MSVRGLAEWEEGANTVFAQQEARIAQLEQVVFGLQQELSRLSVSSSSGEGDSSKYGHKIKKLKKKVKKLGKSSSGFPQFISLKTVHGTYIKAEPLEAEGKVWAHLGGPRIGPWEKFQVVPRGEEEWGEE